MARSSSTVLTVFNSVFSEADQKLSAIVLPQKRKPQLRTLIPGYSPLNSWTASSIATMFSTGVCAWTL